MNDHERRATTEALFRDVNERIAESAERFDADQAEFICECADPACTDRVPATLAEIGAQPWDAIGYETVDVGRYRLIVPGPTSAIVYDSIQPWDSFVGDSRRLLGGVDGQVP